MIEKVAKNRVGDKPIPKLPSVEIQYQNNLLKAKGVKGELDLVIPTEFQLNIDERFIVVKIAKNDIKKRPLQGTLRQLIRNMVQGVSEGFEKVLLLNGVGYRAQVNNNKLVLNLGFSSPIEYFLPNGVKAKVDGNKVTLFSCNKQILGQVAAEIRSYRPPEPYKGKGIFYHKEQIIRKAGKTGKKE